MCIRDRVSRVHRQGVNAVIQGAAAESLRTILTRLHTERWIYTLRMEFFAPIYDEIVAWVHKDDVVQYCDVMYKLMVEATPPGHEIPQVPEFSIGPDWGLSLIHISEPTRQAKISYAVFCLKKKKTKEY